MILIAWRYLIKCLNDPERDRDYIIPVFLGISLTIIVIGGVALIGEYVKGDR